MSRKTEGKKMDKKVMRNMAALFLAGFLVTGAGIAHAKKDKEYQGGFTGPGATEQYNGGKGGYNGPGPALVSVEKALSLSDDTWVTLKGRITQRLGGKEYSFTDGTGTITVKIGGKAWMGQQVGPEDTVELQGEVDKEWSSTHIDVKRVIKQQ